MRGARSRLCVWAVWPCGVAGAALAILCVPPYVRRVCGATRCVTPLLRQQKRPGITTTKSRRITTTKVARCARLCARPNLQNPQRVVATPSRATARTEKAAPAALGREAQDARCARHRHGGRGYAIGVPRRLDIACLRVSARDPSYGHGCRQTCKTAAAS